MVPVGNVTGARGSNVIEAHTQDGLIVRLYSDRAYISSEAQEAEKAVKTKTSTEKRPFKREQKRYVSSTIEKEWY